MYGLRVCWWLSVWAQSVLVVVCTISECAGGCLHDLIVCWWLSARSQSKLVVVCTISECAGGCMYDFRVY